MKKGGVSESEKPAESYMQFMTRMHRGYLEKICELGSFSAAFLRHRSRKMKQRLVPLLGEGGFVTTSALHAHEN